MDLDLQELEHRFLVLMTNTFANTLKSLKTFGEVSFDIKSIFFSQFSVQCFLSEYIYIYIYTYVCMYIYFNLRSLFHERVYMPVHLALHIP